MTQIIIATLALTLVHIWFVPAFFNRVHLKYLLGSRDEELELSVGAARAGRAATNFQESRSARPIKLNEAKKSEVSKVR